MQRSSIRGTTISANVDPLALQPRNGQQQGIIRDVSSVMRVELLRFVRGRGRTSCVWQMSGVTLAAVWLNLIMHNRSRCPRFVMSAAIERRR